MKIKPIPDFPGYFADIFGNIWSIKSRYRRKDYEDISKKRKLKQEEKDLRGYLMISLSKGDNSYTKRIHGLILETFVGKRPNRMQCCHDDGNSQNNSLSNLRWWDTVKNRIKC